MENFKNILCMVTTKAALENVVTLAENIQARLTVVDVVDNSKPTDQHAEIMSARAQEIATLVDPYHNRVQVQTKVLKGQPFKEIIHEVIRNGHDLLIKSPECSALLNRLYHSKDRHLLRKCPCPVFFIRLSPQRPFKTILAAVDVDDTHPSGEVKHRLALNQRIFEAASSLALSNFAELHMVHAWHAVGESAMRSGFISTEKEKIITYVEQLRRQHAANLDEFVHEMIRDLEQDLSHYLQPQTHLVKGSVQKEIPAVAKQLEADLVVMGTAARTGFSGFTMGNTAEMILNQIDCSILVIKPPLVQ